MVRIATWKIYMILGICLLGILYALPNVLSASVRESFPSFLPSDTISLGLDLRGGSHLLLEVDVNSVIAEHFNNIVDNVRSTLKKTNVVPTNFVVGSKDIRLTLATDEENKVIRKALKEALGTDIDILELNKNELVIQLSKAFIQERKSYALNQSIEIVRRRVDETGTKEPTIQRQGENRIILQLPGIDNPERIKSLLGRTAKLTFHLVNVELMGQANTGRLPASSIRVPASKDERASAQFSDYILKRRALITGDMLVDASPSFQNGRPVVSFKLDSRGAKRFADVTTKNVGKPFAIVLDNEVISAPNIQSPILGGQAIITGRFTTQEVQDLSLLLRAGALPAPLKILEERTVGPGLGADSIEAGETASVVGLIAVCVFMILTYGMFGVMAVLALLMNLVLLFAALSILQATLTLPGIAGIVLTIGMAVDANVLIFERIREEALNGRTPVSAIDAGYSSAYSSIVDANITTLIAALILYAFGTGPIRGFAVTLSIGIVTSFFSAIMLTRLMVTTWLWKRKPKILKV